MIYGTQMEEGKVYRSDGGDLLLVTKVEPLPGWHSYRAVTVHFVWLWSVDPSIVARYLGHEHHFEPLPDGALYEEIP